MTFLVQKLHFILEFALTNNAVSAKANFEKLYKIFTDYYLEPKDRLDEVLSKLQLFDLFQICLDFQLKNYNSVLAKLKKTGLSINKLSDKNRISNSIKEIVESNANAIAVVQRAFELKLLTKSEGFSEFLNRIETTLSSFEQDEKFKEFEIAFSNNGNTFTKMSNSIANLDEEYFEEQKRNIEQRNFYSALLSDKFTFADVLNYYKYEDEQTPYITMHKTKGTGIDNVLVVLEEFYWNEYDFASIFDESESENAKRQKNLRLVYVACSRAKKNLRCVKLVSPEEKPKFLERFKEFRITEIKIPVL